MKKPYVAIVDDDSAFAAYLRTFLSLRGYEARCYTRGDEMLASMKQSEAPDVVLLDVMMPDVDGGEVASDLRGDPTLRKIPVVFLTAAIKKQELGGPEGKIGGRTYIAKPVDVQGVINVIERTLAGG